jgi:hypothetical protein
MGRAAVRTDRHIMCLLMTRSMHNILLENGVTTIIPQKPNRGEKLDEKVQKDFV